MMNEEQIKTITEFWIGSPFLEKFRRIGERCQAQIESEKKLKKENATGGKKWNQTFSMS